MTDSASEGVEQSQLIWIGVVFFLFLVTLILSFAVFGYFTHWYYRRRLLQDILLINEAHKTSKDATNAMELQSKLVTVIGQLNEQKPPQIITTGCNHNPTSSNKKNELKAPKDFNESEVQVQKALHESGPKAPQKSAKRRSRTPRLVDNYTSTLSDSSRRSPSIAPVYSKDRPGKKKSLDKRRQKVPGMSVKARSSTPTTSTNASSSTPASSTRNGPKAPIYSKNRSGTSHSHPSSSDVNETTNSQEPSEEVLYDDEDVKRSKSYGDVEEFYDDLTASNNQSPNKDADNDDEVYIDDFMPQGSNSKKSDKSANDGEVYIDDVLMPPHSKKPLVKGQKSKKVSTKKANASKPAGKSKLHKDDESSPNPQTFVKTSKEHKIFIREEVANKPSLNQKEPATDKTQSPTDESPDLKKKESATDKTQSSSDKGPDSTKKEVVASSMAVTERTDDTQLSSLNPYWRVVTEGTTDYTHINSPNTGRLQQVVVKTHENMILYPPVNQNRKAGSQLANPLAPEQFVMPQKHHASVFNIRR